MPVQIACPNPSCARVSRAPDDTLGRRVRCPGCGQPFVAAAAGATAPASATGDGAADPTRSPSAAPVRTVGRFEVRSKLGAGAFGAVYRAYDPQLDREVALKVPHAAVLDNPKRVERFLREAKAAANLRHPHIVPVFDAGRDADHYYIASAFIEGQKLADAVEASEGGLDFERAARLVRELAEALAYAHEQGIVHRDVKPDNVMLDAQDRVHLMDFGLAARQDTESKLTSDGAVMGTPSYMAPEQARGDTAAVGPAGDQYACGVVLYELLTGQTPFAGPIPVVIHNQIHTEPDPPSKARAGLPKDLETVCLKAMAKSPGDRYPDCGALADDLRRWLADEPIAARRLTKAEQLTRWARRNKRVSSLSALAVGLLLLAAVVSSAMAVRAGIEASRADSEAKKAQSARGVAEQKSEEAKTEAARARAEAERADRNFREVTTQKQVATAALARAETQAKLARSKAEEADRERSGKEEQLIRSQILLCAANIRMAGSALKLDRYDLARQALKETPARHRGWEYMYLDNLLNRTVADIDDWKDAVGTIEVSSKGLVAVPGPAAIQLWDERGKQLARTLENDPTEPERARVKMAFSGDGKRLAAVGFSQSRLGRISIWETETGKLLRTVPGARAFALNADGKLLARSPDSVYFDITNVDDGTPVSSFASTAGSVRDWGISPDGSRLVAAVLGGYRESPAESVMTWTVANGQLVPQNRKLPDRVANGQRMPQNQKSPDTKDISWSALNFDQSRLLTASRVAGLEITPLDGNAAAVKLQTSRVDVSASAFSRDGKCVAIGRPDGLIETFDILTGKSIRRVQGHSGAVKALCYFPTSELLSRSDQQVCLWSFGTADPVVLDRPERGVSSVPMTPAGQLSESANVSGKASVAMSSDGQWVAASLGRTPAVWNTVTQRKAFDLGTTYQDVAAAAFRPDGTELIAYRELNGGQKNRYSVWSLDKKSLVRETAPPATKTPFGRLGPAPWMPAIAINANGRQGADNLLLSEGLRVWEYSDPASNQKPIGSGGRDIAFHPENPWHLLAGDKVVETRSQTALVKFQIQEYDAVNRKNAITCLAFSWNGSLVGYAYDSGLVEVFDAATGRMVQRIKAHGSAARGLAFVAGGPDRVVSGGEDGTVRLWDVASGIEMMRLEDHSGPVIWVGTSRDGSVLASAGADGVRVRRSVTASAPAAAPMAKTPK